MSQTSIAQVSSQIPYRVLARKYRPQKLSELVGQDLLVKTLMQGIERNRLPHAFLLYGIRGVGKTTTARILAKALNCRGIDGQGGPTPDPCGVCESCKAILEDRHLDVLEMDAASRTGVDDVREVIEAARYKAVNGRYKVYIIDEVHMLSKSAFNALLKTLEEPPPHVKFIFATTEIRKVPETVLSRCMRFDLKRVEPKILLDHFSTLMAKENIPIEEEALSLIVRAADGSVRDGLSLLDQAIALSEGSITSASVRDMLGMVDRGQIFALLKNIFQGHIEDVLTQIKDLYQRGGDPVILIEDLLDLVYWLTCLKTSPHLLKDVTWPESDRRQGAELIESLSLPALMRVWQVMHKGYHEVLDSPLPSQAAEMVLIRVAYLSDLPHAEEILAAVQGVPRPASHSPAPSHPTVHQTLKPVTTQQVENEISSEASPAPSTPNSAAPQLPANFEELLVLLQSAKEPILLGNVMHDVHLVSYASGVLTIRLADSAPKTLPAQLRQTLERITGQPWKIEIVSQGGEPTITQQKKIAHDEKVKESQEHPLVQSLLEGFPGATITAK
ncbi:MAG: DNA polymerase III subunit gamma/tau [Alphaproteobacteria bacterium]|nr:DNA polymerase III subunit gamma/tau [Alphaproteobacteria bacterium]